MTSHEAINAITGNSINVRLTSMNVRTLVEKLLDAEQEQGEQQEAPEGTPEQQSITATHHQSVNFPDELKLLIHRLLAPELTPQGTTQIYPVYAKRSNGSYDVVTLVGPEEGADPGGQSTVYVQTLSRAGAIGHDGFFGMEADCNKWVEDAVRKGAYVRV